MVRLSLRLLGGFQARLESGEVLTFQTKKARASLLSRSWTTGAETSPLRSLAKRSTAAAFS